MSGQNPFRRYIASQREVLGGCYETGRQDFAPFAADRPRSLALVGSGTSFNALLAVTPLLGRRCEPRLFNPLDFMDALDGRARFDLTVILSQSGMSETSVGAARKAGGGGTSVAVTADTDSAIAACDLPIVPLAVGAETIGPKTVGYTGSVATLLGFAVALGATPALEASALDAAMTEALLRAGEDVAAAAADLRELDHLMLGARGPHLATATEGALKIAEVTGVPAAAYPLEELLHGRLQMMTARSRAILLADNEADLQRAYAARDALRDLGLTLRVFDLSGSGEGDLFPTLPPMRPPVDLLTAVVPFQLLADAMARDRGLQPGRMPFPDLSRRLALKVAASE